MGRLDDKIAIITGSSSGIGRAIAVQYAFEGAKIVCADLSPASTRSRTETKAASQLPTHEAINQVGGTAVFHQTDVGDAAQVRSLVQRAVEEFGRLDWDTTLRVNGKSVFLGCKYALAQMLQQEPYVTGDRGWIVNMSSIASLVALENTGPYCASKGAVSSLTRQAALDYAPHNIHINAICPGYVQTPFLGESGSNSAFLAELEKRHPLGGPGEPSDIACVAVMLASEDARWMTGVCLPVDGGYIVK